MRSSLNRTLERQARIAGVGRCRAEFAFRRWDDCVHALWQLGDLVDVDDNTKDVLLVLIGAGVTVLATRLGHGYAIALNRRNDRKDAYLEFLDACGAIERWLHASEAGAGIPPGATLSDLVNVQLAIATAKVSLFHHGGMRAATNSFQAAQKSRGQGGTARPAGGLRETDMGAVRGYVSARDCGRTQRHDLA